MKTASVNESKAPRARNSWKRGLKNFVAFLVVAGFLLYVWEHRTELIGTLDASPSHIGALCALVFLTWVFSGLQAVTIYRAVQVPISIGEGITLTVAGTFGNYLPMRAGTVVRAVYLKEVHGLGIARFGGISGLRSLLVIIAAGIVGLLGLIPIWVGSAWNATRELGVIFLLLVAMPVALMMIPCPRFSWLPQRLKQLTSDATGAYDELRRKPQVAVKVVLLLVAQYFTLGLRFVVSGNALGVDIPASSVLLMAPLAALMSFMAITPGGLGLREAVMGYVSLDLGYSFADGLFVGTVDRAILLTMVAPFGGLAFLMLWRRMHSVAAS
jgi:uncharacterized membrane protein YbhN (UPF0104 family)